MSEIIGSIVPFEYDDGDDHFAFLLQVTSEHDGVVSYRTTSWDFDDEMPRL